MTSLTTHIYDNAIKFLFSFENIQNLNSRAIVGQLESHFTAQASYSDNTWLFINADHSLTPGLDRHPYMTLNPASLPTNSYLLCCYSLFAAFSFSQFMYLQTCINQFLVHVIPSNALNI